MSYSTCFPYAWGEPKAAAIFKRAPEDFVVEEILDLQAAGEGEHLYLHIRKTGENSLYVADKIADYFKCSKMDVGLAGMKDRQAVTSQWFSVYLPDKHKNMDWQAFIQANALQAELLSAIRHTKKLRRGQHQGNRFRIRLYGIAENAETESRLQGIGDRGVPNYFGEQRFGIAGNNLEQYAAMVDKLAQQSPDRKRLRNKKRQANNKDKILISAARAWLFNQVLAQRVQLDNWQAVLPGDVLLENMPSGPLWGRGRIATGDVVAQLEKTVVQEFSAWCDHLEHSGLSQERRPLKMIPEDLSWEWQDQSLKMTFTLGIGQYATSLLREVCQLQA